MIPVTPRVIELDAPPAPPLGRHRDASPKTERLQIVYLSGEPHTPGHSYRVERYIAAARSLGHDVGVDAADRAEIAAANCPAPDLVVIWRAVWSPMLETACATWRSNGARIAFDVDDYMFDPDLARVDVIDGIRSLNVAEREVAAMYARVQQTLSAADVGFATTESLAGGMRRQGKTAFVLPNGFDDQTFVTSRRAVQARRRQPDDGLVRIGYAAGSCTHQQDFTNAVRAVARLLREHPHCRLVLFRVGAFGTMLLDPAEFPELTGLENRIEWRPMVPLARLPEEMARFDINIAPLAVGNVFCEAKSELKYFEAALVDVPTVASPTRPFARAIRDGVTGLLAASEESWHAALESLATDPERRREMGRAAHLDVLWKFGPDGRREALAAVIDRIFADETGGAGGFRNSVAHAPALRPLPEVPPTEVLFERQSGDVAEVAVVIPCYNYARFVDEALDSVAAQTAASLELIVVDDCSTDDSVAVVDRWLKKHGGRFVTATLLRNRVNSGLSLTRNAGFAWASAPLVFPLDADNVLDPHCLAALRDALSVSTAAAAHPTLARFGLDETVLPALPWSPDRLRHGNYIDAMALIRRSAWARCGGYARIPYGWEDYDFWCVLVEEGLWSQAVPAAVGRYRVHGTSMLHTTTDVPANRRRLVEVLEHRHPWLDIPLPSASGAASAGTTAPPRSPQSTCGDSPAKAPCREPAEQATSATGDTPPPPPAEPADILPVTRAEDPVASTPRPAPPRPIGRRAALLDTVDVARERGLEIGPLASPLVTKQEGPIEYVDHLDTAGLREKYGPDTSVDRERIVDVDHVLEAGRLPAAVRSGRFDYVIAAHVFEHIADPLGWLCDCAAALRPGGLLALVVPDQRFTFDLPRPLTRLSDWIEAWLVGQRQPSPRHIMEAATGSARIVGGSPWQRRPTADELRPTNAKTDAWALSLAKRGVEDYVDVHCTVCTPASCLELLARGAALDLHPFRLARFHDTVEGGFEFCMQLRAAADVPPADRAASFREAAATTHDGPGELDRDEPRLGAAA
ncbi:MAG: glycosyltransferase [Planctomycetia bacterium]